MVGDGFNSILICQKLLKTTPKTFFSSPSVPVDQK